MSTMKLLTFEHIGGWEVLQLCLILVVALFVIGLISMIPLRLPFYLVSFAVVTVWVIRNPPERLPSPMFWVLFIACFPFTFGLGNAASVILYGLLISHLTLFPPNLNFLFQMLFVII